MGRVHGLAALRVARVNIAACTIDVIETRTLGPGDLVWTSATGLPLSEADFRERVWQPATIIAGLEGLRIHDLRHTCVAMWSRSFASPRAAAKWATASRTMRPV